MRNTTTALLIICLIFAPAPKVHSFTPPPQKEFLGAVVCGLLAIGVGAVVIVGLVKMCKHIPGAPKDPDYPTNALPPMPPTNPPPVINPIKKPVWWNPFTWWRASSNFMFNDNPVHVWDISQYGIPDLVSTNGPFVYNKLLATRLQSTVDLVNWRDELCITGWVSDGGTFFAFYTNGIPALTTYSTPDAVTNFIPLDIGTGREPRKFFRLSQ